jgi:hypothetical protein
MFFADLTLVEHYVSPFLQKRKRAAQNVVKGLIMLEV